ncbi:hypothetical protein [Undibacterium baiyunense]|uniref:Uncharacterized protein n=1 Tax=Undibacterium baiyunense TaxID=2828731 RepID=A0A941I4Y3_9BURK|nr:hypothetical protein [Undibacterium baiyunense]MBR7747424.1 hypothetical protein [Undibacterium baiyunense]
MKTYSIKIRTATGTTQVFAIAPSAKAAGENIDLPEEAFGLTVTEI